jgi:hypothetical protein
MDIQSALSSAIKKAYFGQKKFHTSEKMFRAGTSLN